MAESWVNSAERTGSDLHLELAPAGRRRAALADALRAAVREGRLPPGTRLPPYRSLAADLGVARNTVADAYAELVAEGWLTARQGSGTRVAERVAPRAAVRRPKPVPAPAEPSYNLLQGQPDAGSFPRTGWLAAARRALAAAPDEAFGPGDPRGRVELRTALAEYLARARGVRTDPERIVVCAGFAHGLRLLYEGGVLRGPLAVEEYGLPYHRGLLERARVRLLPLPVDGRGADTGALAGLPGAREVLLTPAHQFPTGVPLHHDRRRTATDWARARGGLVLEDDYDGEFRYDRQPVGALQGLDPERVVYIGSVSKSLSPALRLGWMVLPDGVLDGVLEVKGQREAWVSVPDQLTLAEFITSGGYDRHLRKMRQRYRRRRDQLTSVLAEQAPHITVSGVAAGLHAVLRLPAGTERAVVQAAARQGLAVDSLSAHRHPQASGPAPDGLVIGYATPPDSAYTAALATLCCILPPP
ncbi:PLP-dependent aminotransferase family protein [Streptomyces sp. NPDC086023]|uniref:MocR-like pyridoxine biosynthesis transcription factor PdxR n=1 Tax=Streptomyces sp. NPDC086023 TaxID=3365746 RepID=UPI0037CE8BFE